MTSGVASSSCPGASGAAYLFNIGSNALSASATDYAGNGASASASFTVSVTTGSLCNLTQRFVSSAGIANSLCVKLNAGSIQAFINEVNAQRGKRLTNAEANLLISIAGML